MDAPEYGISVHTHRSFAEAMTAVKESLAAEGFGIVAEIDMQATMKNKIGVDIPAQTILGACNPHAAKRALEAEPSVGLLLPCNVVVREGQSGTIVEAINTQMIAQVTGNAALDEVSTEIGARLQAVLDRVAAA